MTTSNLFVAEQFRGQGCLNIDQGINLWHLLNHVIWAKIPGEIIELGCLSGRTASVLATTIARAGDDRQIWLYDSFEGLPQIAEEDGNIPLIPENFKTTAEEVLRHFKQFGAPEPIIVPGWFSDTLPDKLPPQIAFAHLDGDLYHSIKESLVAVYPRLTPGAVVVVDDYCDDELSPQIIEAYNNNPYHRSPYSGAPPTDKIPPRQYAIGNWLPAVKRAVDEFMADKPEEFSVMIAGEEKHGFFRKM